MRILPVKENVSVLHRLSMKTILLSHIKAHLNRKLIKQIGMHVPGPLHKIKSNLSLTTIGTEYKIDAKVVKAEVK